MPARNRSTNDVRYRALLLSDYKGEKSLLIGRKLPYSGPQIGVLPNIFRISKLDMGHPNDVRIHVERDKVDLSFTVIVGEGYKPKDPKYFGVTDNHAFDMLLANPAHILSRSIFEDIVTKIGKHIPQPPPQREMESKFRGSYGGAPIW